MLRPVTTLFRSLAIYGVGDVMTSAVSLLLLPIFTRYLAPADYGVITMLLTIEAVTKVAVGLVVTSTFLQNRSKAEGEAVIGMGHRAPRSEVNAK